MTVDIQGIYSEYFLFVYNVALKMLNNRNDAEDVAQEVFVKLQEKLESFLGASSMKTFIYRVTINKCIDLIRRQHSQTDRAVKSFQSGEITISTDRLLIDSLLSKLTAGQRAAVLLYEIAGCSQKEIALILKISEGTVRSRISRSIKKMAKFVAEEA